MFRPIVHFALHFIIPGAASKVLFSPKWKSAWFTMMLAMIIDLDHLLAEEVFDPNRCGINFHPLHSFPAIAVYGVLVVIPKTRIFGLGLLIHIFLDGIDCFWMQM